MVFCNKIFKSYYPTFKQRHNPYFNRWFSAIRKDNVQADSLISGHNPYFNRWFSAIPLEVHCRIQ